MSGYAQTEWVDGGAPYVTAANLNKLEFGLAAALGFDTAGALRALGAPGVGVTGALTRGGAALGDGLGGWWRWDAASNAADDGALVLLPTGHSGAGRWVRLMTLYESHLAQGSAGQMLSRATSGMAWREIPPGRRNLVINSAFAVNQRAHATTAAAGVYTYDRWKAGASGVTTSEASAAGLKTVTISAGSLVQVIEAGHVPPGTQTMVLSWTGTAQGKLAGGAFGSSPRTLEVTGGSNVTIEFQSGTLTQVQLEVGATPTAWEFRPLAVEALDCQRYYTRLGGNSEIGAAAYAATGGSVRTTFLWPVPMRAAPSTVALVGTFTTSGVAAAGLSIGASSAVGVLVVAPVSAGVGNLSWHCASGYIHAEAEL